MNRRRMWGASLIAITLAASALGCSGGGDGVPEVAAVVGGDEIPSADTEDLILTYLESANGKALARTDDFDRKDVAQSILSFQIKNLFLQQIAEAEGIELTEEQKRAADALAESAPKEETAKSGVRAQDLKQAFDNGRLSQLIAEKLFSDAPVSETQLQNAYEEQKDRFAASWRVKLGVAVFRSSEIAAKARQEVLAGKGLEAVAAELSGSYEGTADFTPAGIASTTGQTAEGSPEFLAAVGKLEKGQITEPFQLALDTWIIGVAMEREDLPALTFEQAKDGLRAILEDRSRKDLFDDWFYKRLQKAKVKVDGHYGKWDPSTGNVV